MAKLRVYELARELNMTNKALLDKMQQMGISVRSHMSALEDDVVEQVKTTLFQARQEQVEEKRVRSTVIRRRKRARETASGQEAAPETAEEETAPEEIAETAAEEAPAGEAATAPEVEAGEAAVAEHPAEVAAGEQVSRKVDAESIARRIREQEKGEPARVLKKPEPEMPEQPPVPPEEAVAAGEPAVETPESGVEAVAEAAPATEKAEPEVVEPEKVELPVEAEAEPEAPVEEPAAPPAEEGEIAAETGFAEETPEEAPAGSEAAEEAKKAAKAKKKKKKDKDFPAKIISLPEKPVAPTPPPPPPSAAGEEKPAPAEGEAATGDAASKRKKKSKKKGGGEEETDSKFLKKKISFRKKAVVEGADLYDKGSSRMRKGKKGGKQPMFSKAKPTATTPKAIKRRIKVDEAIVLSELAKRLGVKANEIIKKLMAMGTMATINQSLDFETASIIAAEFGYEVEKASFAEETVLQAQEDKPEELTERPPVVTVMGHVDHGKTSLLDAIRETRVTDGEAGGITQHIGAYVVDLPDRGRITFLDTPGHEAFTAMRARGASVTDLVVLVVAADDGVMPQTIEAVNHSKAAGVPIIVAVNKMDKAGADPDRVTRQLAEKDLVPEDWGGDTIFVHVSAKQKTGLDSLLEMILLQSEVLELKANADKPARGHVVEARMDQGRGPVASVLVQEGTLRTGQSVVCGMYSGKIRAMFNERGEPIDEAGPSIPAEILGLSGVPNAGDEVAAVANDKVAKQVSEHRQEKHRGVELARTSKVSLDTLFEQMGRAEVKDLNLIIRADVQGSVEALRESLLKLDAEVEEVKIDVIHSGTGTITESDVALASVSEAIIIAFNTRPQGRIVDMAQTEEVEIRYYDVIYNALKDIKDAITGLMSSTYKEHVMGRAEVRDTFTIPKVGTIAGSFITNGKIERGGRARLLRDGVVMADSRIGSLKRFKEDVKEVQHGYECGIGLENYNDVKVGDVLEAYYLEEIKPSLE
ncbi:MAG: translation initiation factor IF-2 [Desulfatibacillaceae bacterium]